METLIAATTSPPPLRSGAAIDRSPLFEFLVDQGVHR
jgi:hypothetical protein